MWRETSIEEFWGRVNWIFFISNGSSKIAQVRLLKISKNWKLKNFFFSFKSVSFWRRFFVVGILDLNFSMLSISINQYDIWWRCKNQKQILMSSFWRRINYIKVFFDNFVFNRIPDFWWLSWKYFSRTNFWVNIYSQLTLAFKIPPLRSLCKV